MTPRRHEGTRHARRKSSCLRALAATLLLLTAGNTTPGSAGQTPDAGRQSRASTKHYDANLLSKPTYQVRVEKNVRIPMRDGVTLAADIYRPDVNGKFPVLLLRTFYGRASP